MSNILLYAGESNPNDIVMRSIAVAITLTGFGSTAAMGVLAVAMDAPLVGQAAAAAQNTLTPVMTVATTGFVATAEQGALTSKFDIALTGFSVSGAHGTLVPEISNETNPGTWGRGAYGYYGRIYKRNREGQLNQLEIRKSLLDEFSSKRYGDIIDSSLPKAVKREVAAIVRPFVKVKAKGKPVPAVDQVDWDVLQRNVDAANALFKVWLDEIAIFDDDEDMLLILFNS